MHSKPARLSRTRSSASTTTTRSGPVRPGSDCMAPMVLRLSQMRKRTNGHGPPAERRTLPTSSVADRDRVGGDRGHAAGGDGGLGDDHLDGGPLPGHALDREARADLVGSGPHPGESEVAVRDTRRIEPLPVIRDAQPDAARDATDLEPDLPGTRVLDHVVERLLRDPREDLLDRQGKPFVERALDHDREAEPT